MKKFEILISNFLFLSFLSCEDKVKQEEVKVNIDKEIGYVSFCDKLNDSIKGNKFIEFIKEFKNWGSRNSNIQINDRGFVIERYDENCKTIHIEDKKGNIIGAKEKCTREPDRKTKQFINEKGELYLKEFNVRKKITNLLCDVVFFSGDGQNDIYIGFDNYFYIYHFFFGISATYIDESVFIKENKKVKNNKRENIEYKLKRKNDSIYLVKMIFLMRI